MDLRMRGYAARLVKDGITVNAVAPSLNETEMMPAARRVSAQYAHAELEPNSAPSYKRRRHAETRWSDL
jgi:NAD(P)-dependent dehydrogenase (short-subunit alcohol dehydrogenase family)